MQQQYAPPYQNQVMPQMMPQMMPVNPEYKMMQGGRQASTEFHEIEQDPSVTFFQEPKCCGCFPEFTFNRTFAEREMGDKIYDMKPVKNCFCFCYETKIKNKSDHTILESKRPFCNFACLGCCCLTRYKQKGDNITGSQKWPCWCRNLCCTRGFYVNVQDQEKYFIGGDKKDCCFGGEHMNVEDIWNAERTLRLGSTYYIQRACCCIHCAPLFHLPCFRCFRCCIGEKHWAKLVFPKNVSQADKAILMAAISNGSGEGYHCCIPFQ